MTDLAVGQFWLHKDGRRLEVTGIVEPGRAYADGLVILRVWGPAPRGHRMTKMRPDMLPKAAERWHPDEFWTAEGFVPHPEYHDRLKFQGRPY